jgi:hypothetical protein
MDMNVFGGLFGIRSLGEGKEMTGYRAWRELKYITYIHMKTV